MALGALALLWIVVQPLLALGLGLDVPIAAQLPVSILLAASGVVLWVRAGGRKDKGSLVEAEPVPPASPRGAIDGVDGSPPEVGSVSVSVTCFLTRPVLDLPSVLASADVFERPDYVGFDLLGEHLTLADPVSLTDRLNELLTTALTRLAGGGVTHEWLQTRGLLRVYLSLHPDDGDVLATLRPDVLALAAQTGAELVVDVI